MITEPIIDVTDEEEISEFLNVPWIKYDSDHFTHKGTGLFKWDKVDGAYCTMFVKDFPTKLADVVRIAFRLARSIAVTIVPGKFIDILYQPKTSYAGYAEDAKRPHISVNTQVFDEKEMPFPVRIDEFLGEATHEMCHIRYTDVEVLKLYRKEKLKGYIHNVLEDARIEYLCGDDFPNFMGFIATTRFYWMKIQMDKMLAARDAEISVGTEEMADHKILLDLFFKFVRYPAEIKKEDVAKFIKPLTAIREVLTPYPMTNEEVVSATDKVYGIIIKFIPPDFEKEENAEGESGEGGEGDGEPAEWEFTDADLQELEGLAEKMMEILSVEGSGKEVMGMIKHDSHEGKRLKYDLDKEHDKGIVRGEGLGTFFTYAPEDAGKYQSDKREIMRYVGGVSSLMKFQHKEHKKVFRGMRSGYLDAAKLPEAKLGIESVYERFGKVTTNKVKVILLIDESGSMGDGVKIEQARKTAILFNEVIKLSKDAEVYIYGHSADLAYYGSTDIVIYKEPNFNRPFALGSVHARSQNRDGVAIYECAKRVRSKSKEPIVMFVISDGEPAAHQYHGDSAIAHVKEQVRQVEAMNIEVINVCIESSYEPELMFKNFVVLTNLSTLARDLGQVMKKVLRRMVQVTEEYC